MKEFSFVTYNIDHRGYDSEQRLDNFISLMGDLSPDIVVVQEGTNSICERLIIEMKKINYRCKVPPIMRKRRTWELIFSKFGGTLEFLPFKRSRENRGISLLRVGKEKKLGIATSQLDVGIFQMDQIGEIQSLDALIFGGDTNLAEYQDIVCPEGWVDAWYEEGHNDDRYTLNRETNNLVQSSVKSRPDRIWFRHLECKEFRLIGSEKVSSHYGVFARFSLSRIPKKENVGSEKRCRIGQPPTYEKNVEKEESEDTPT